jgi:hypothetical protein
MGRSILAVIVGYFVTAAGVMATAAVINVLFPLASPEAEFARFHSVPWLMLALSTGIVFAIVGGYVAAVIAKRAETKHALALGILMVVLGILTMAIEFGKYPLWYQLALVVVPLPAVMVGASLRVRGKSKEMMYGQAH